MIFKRIKHNPFFLLLLLLVAPLRVQPSVMDVCSSVGQAASVIDVAADLTGHTVVSPIPEISLGYNLGSLFGLVSGLNNPLLLQNISSSLSRVQFASSFVKGLLPEAIKSKCTPVVDGSKWTKAGLLAAYISYDLLKEKREKSFVDKAQAAHAVLSLQLLAGKLAYFCMPDSIKWASSELVPNVVKQKYNQTKIVLDKNPWMKSMTVAAYISYKALQATS